MPNASTTVPRPAHVLLVEDNPADADLMRIALEDADATGFVIEHVTRLSTALERLSGARSVDVVLLDLGLPDTDGFSGLERIRVAAPRVAVVVLTGLSEKSAGTTALEKGAQDYVVKGWIESSEVVSRIRRAIERRRVLSELEAVGRDLRSAGARLGRIGDGKRKGR